MKEKGISIGFIITFLIGTMFFVLFSIQFIEIFTKDSIFVFFQILVSVVWFGGAFIFYLVSFLIWRTNRRKREE